MRAVKTCRRFLSQKSGNVAVMTAFAATTLIGILAFAVDEGRIFVDRRNAQSVADLAALTAVASPPNADFLANRTVARNQILLSAPLRVQPGLYTADAALATGARFKPVVANKANAVRVTLDTSSTLYFGKFLTGKDSVPIHATATAANTALASFSIGSRLLQLDGGVLNQLLSQKLGGEIELSVMDYRSLADLRIDMFDLLGAVAKEARVTGPTYESVLTEKIDSGILLQALSVTADGSGANPGEIRLLKAIRQDIRTPTKIVLGPGIDIGRYRDMPVDQKPRDTLSLSALDVLAIAARLSDGKHQVALAFDLDVPGVATAAVSVTIGEPPVESGWVAVGEPGATVRTAQTRVALRITVKPLGLPLEVKAPIYAEVANSSATLSAMTCGGAKSGRSATLAVSPGVAEAWIADFPDEQWENMDATPQPSPALLTRVLLVKLNGLAHVRMASLRPVMVTFSDKDIRDGVVKTATSQDYLTSLIGSLLGDLRISASLGGLKVNLPAEQKIVVDALTAVTRPLDEALSTVFAVLGVGLGQADVRVHDVRCDRAVLVD